MRNSRKIKYRVVSQYWDDIDHCFKKFIWHQCDNYPMAEHFALTSVEPYDLEIKKVFIGEEFLGEKSEGGDE